MKLTLITDNELTPQLRHVRKWLSAAAELRASLYEHDGYPFDPLGLSETATVGFLAAAAGRADLYALTEYPELECRRSNGSRLGRCDLWVASDDESLHWMVEFKVCWYRPRSQKDTLWKRMEEAIECAKTRSSKEADERWACTVFGPNEDWSSLTSADRKKWKSPGLITELGQEKVDLAFRVDGAAGPVFLLFKRVKRGASAPKQKSRQQPDRKLALNAA